MALLSLFRFTNVVKGGDVATAPTDPATGGWQNSAASPVINALNGDDVVQSTGVFADLIDTASFGGASPSLYSAAVANGGSGVINMGNGKDTISGITSGLRSAGILNGAFGGSNTLAQIVMGTGDDKVIGNNVSATSGNTFGIYNTGKIDLGTGNDFLQGVKSSTSSTGAAVFNSGTILGNTGNDEFDAMQGGWAGSGSVDGGSGDDVVMGFGSGSFNGGAGIKDEIILPQGDYTIAYNVTPTATSANFKLARVGSASVMNVSGFEAIGSIDPLAGIHPTATDGLRPSAFSIDALGAFTSITFVAANAPL